MRVTEKTIYQVRGKVSANDRCMCTSVDAYEFGEDGKPA